MTAKKDSYYGDKNRRPPRPPFHGKNIPAGLRPLARWIGWRFSWKDKDGKWAKIPLDPHQRCRKLAKTNDPTTWADLSTTAATVNTAALANPESVDGLGFVFADGDGLFGLDIDGCRNPDTGELSDLAVNLISAFDTYSEISPSGMGVKLIGRGTFDGKGRKVKLPDGQELELYTRGRYFTLTGIRIDGTSPDISECAAPLAKFIEDFKPVSTGGRPAGDRPVRSTELTDDEVIDKLTRTAKNAAEGNRLWRGDTSGNGGDDSAADLALCNLIAFYTPDPSRIDAIFRRSGLMREKWNRADYSSATIAKALEGRSTFYGERNGTTHGASPPAGGSSFALTDMGNAERLISHYAQDLRRVGALNAWYVWNGKRWVEDKNSLVFHLMKEVVRTIPAEAKQDDDKGRRQKVFQHAINSEAKSAIAAAAWLAQSDPAITTDVESFDADPMVLNCSNGTLDLKNGELRPHSRGDLLTSICPTEYHTDAKCPLWESTLALIFPAESSDHALGGNEGLITYLQRLFGLCLTGRVDEAILPIFWGGGANGKSTILNTIRAVLGGFYAIQAPHTFLMSKQNDTHPTELTDLHHRRLVIATESKKNRRIDEPLVKWLTGGERIRARRMRQDFFEFDPTHKLILCTNHRPRISDTDEGIWRRVALVPFLQRFWNPDKKGEFGPDHLRQNKQLSRELQNESSGILNWMVRGCLQWQVDGLGIPPEVEEETERYRDDEDTLGSYLSDRVTKSNSPGGVSLGELFADFRNWCDKAGVYPGTARSLAGDLRDRGYVIERGTRNVMTCKGLFLIDASKTTTLDDYNDD